MSDVSRSFHDKHVIVGNSFYEPLPGGGSPTAPTVSTRITTGFAPIGVDFAPPGTLTVPIDGPLNQETEPLVDLA